MKYEVLHAPRTREGYNVRYTIGSGYGCVSHRVWTL